MPQEAKIEVIRSVGRLRSGHILYLFSDGTVGPTRFPREDVLEAARQIVSRETLMPTDGPSEPHRVG